MIDKHRTLYFTDIVNRVDRLDPLRTCLELLDKHPSTKSGKYYMNPQGLGLSSLAQVYCDMTSKNGVGVTLIEHDRESRTFVNGGYEAAGSYKRRINYDIFMEHIVAIMKQSKYCKQFIKYECYQSVLLTDLNDLHGWWVSCQGSRMNYWGGAAFGSRQWKMCKWNDQQLCRWRKM